MKVESEKEVVLSLKVRAPAGCFHREHSPHAYALIDRRMETAPPGVTLEEHESGPELLVVLAAVTAGLQLTESVVDLFVALVKARSEGIRKGDGPSEPVELIVRRRDGRAEEEMILRIGARDPLDQAELERRLNAAVERVALQPPDEVDRRA